MKNTKRARAQSARIARENAVRERLNLAASREEEQVLRLLGTGRGGLSKAAAEASRERYGANTVTYGKKQSLGKRICGAFINPFTVVLLALAAVSVCTDVVFARSGEENYVTVLIITAMVLISGILRFVQETRSGNAAARLGRMIHTTTCVEREETGREEIPLDDVTVGDLIHLSAGDMVPADVRILTAKDLFISQAALTGESAPVEKDARPADASGAALSECSNLAFMGSNVISGSAVAVAAAVGNDTMLGGMARVLTAKPPKTSFEKGVNEVSWVLIRFMLIMVPVVLFVNGFTKGDWMQAALFAISVAVGLTPEMMPMIVTTSLARGAVAMSRKKVIIKNLSAIQNLGSMDILCTDKTGTLTQDKVVLEYHLDIHGREDDRVLRHAFLNSFYQTGLKNLIDVAIISRQRELAGEELETAYTKVDEIPFDFNRRRMSVVVRDGSGKTQMITKGAVEEMLKCCAFAEYNGKVEPLSGAIRTYVLARSDELNAAGMRVIAVAHKTNPAPVGEFSAADEEGMVLLGFLAFLDPPKKTTAAALRALRDHGVAVKVLTGDNEKVTCRICAQVGLEAGQVLLGSQLDSLDDGELAREAEKITVFAKLSPAQKARVVRVLREAGHSVGYMGDGINDAAAMKASDVGISVDTAVDVAKESAGVVLLEKDLGVLEEGILEGRKTYANMIKYIKMTASSNFGNMFSVLAASAFLPFLPMESIHLILLNLIYDISCTAIPWDNVDREYLRRPRKWDASSISRFMLWMGPTSSVFDIVTYLLMYFVLCPAAVGGRLFGQLTDPAARALYVALFQTGWFVESMWSQTLVIHMIRTPKLPFVQSRASGPVLGLTFAGIAAVTAIPFTPLGAALGLTPLPGAYFGALGGIILCYMLLATLVKNLYVRRCGELL
ncbi:MAG: magnesium-translocating P-type ATPase [Oscillibacter sp.]|jgi:Mg2+-importing ATPase|nr:magnesium-translocating P-type ATPase [Oscillibacter sp.]